ncbi:MAG: HEAT repeat domain-containing protein [Actinomycetota bacterium]
MSGEPPRQGGPEGGPELAAQSMSILSSLHAAMVNFHLYPPTSDIVEESVRRAREDLEQALAAWGSVTFCELEGKLLINDLSLDERDQARPNTAAFLKDLAMWEVRSITFDRGLTDEELRQFMEIFSRKRAERTLEGSLGTLLEERDIRNIKVDEKIYVSLSKGEGIATASAGPGGEAMDLLRDEVFVRYLLGASPARDVSREEVSELMSDPERINAAFTSVIRGFESSGGAVGPEKAAVIRDTMDRMYQMVEHLADGDLKNALGEQMVVILSALEPETLVEVLAEKAPLAVRDAQVRREIISSVEGENVLALTDQIIEKYKRLLASRDGMDPQDYEDISSVLNEIVADLYAEGDPAYHAEITRRLRETGLLAELTASHPQAGREIRAYSVVTEVRASGSLRALEGLDEDEVIAVAGKLLDMGEGAVTSRIVDVSSRNLVSERPDFRLRACSFLKRLHLDFKERGHREEILDRMSELSSLLAAEYNPEVKAGLLDLLGCIAGDFFAEGRVADFSRACEALVDCAEASGDERVRRAAAAALASLNPWDVGRPLIEYFYGEDDDLRRLAARVLPYMEVSLTAAEIAERVRGEDEIKITPELAAACSAIGEPVFGELKEILESNAREEVYLRALSLLEAMGGNSALALVRSVEGNPIPAVRAQAVRSMARMSPGDPSLLTHFMRALSDEDVEVRREAVRGLGTIDDPRSVDTFLAILQGKAPSGGEEHPRVEEAACLALARLGPERAVAPLSDILRKKVFSLRRRDAHPRTKAAACYALGEIGGPEVVELIRGYLDDPDPVLRNEARKAVAALRKKGYTD